MKLAQSHREALQASQMNSPWRLDLEFDAFLDSQCSLFCIERLRAEIQAFNKVCPWTSSTDSLGNLLPRHRGPLEKLADLRKVVSTLWSNSWRWATKTRMVVSTQVPRVRASLLFMLSLMSSGKTSITTYSDSCDWAKAISSSFKLYTSFPQSDQNEMVIPSFRKQLSSWACQLFFSKDLWLVLPALAAPTVSVAHMLSIRFPPAFPAAFCKTDIAVQDLHCKKWSTANYCGRSESLQKVSSSFCWVFIGLR